MDKRATPRVPIVRAVSVGRLREMTRLMSKDVSEGGIFLEGCPAEIGEVVSIELEIDEVRKTKLRATATVVRRTTDPVGAGCRFDKFEEGHGELARLIQHLLIPGATRELLVVDDSKTSRENIRRLLEPLSGLRITEAENGRAALELLKVSTFDCILTDLTLPELDGFGFVEELRSIPNMAATPIVMLTARDDEGDLERAFSLGITSFLRKPFQTPDLIYALCRPLGIKPHGL